MSMACEQEQFHRDLYNIVHQDWRHESREEREGRKPVLPPVALTPLLF